MTKQEEIREVIDLYTDDGCLYLEKDCVWCKKGDYCASDNDSYTCLMRRLGELGVVVKVECPNCEWSQFVDGESVGMTPCHSCNSMGYLVEPLIRDE